VLLTTQDQEYLQNKNFIEPVINKNIRTICHSVVRERSLAKNGNKWDHEFVTHAACLDPCYSWLASRREVAALYCTTQIHVTDFSIVSNHEYSTISSMICFCYYYTKVQIQQIRNVAYGIPFYKLPLEWMFKTVSVIWEYAEVKPR